MSNGPPWGPPAGPPPGWQPPPGGPPRWSPALAVLFLVLAAGFGGYAVMLVMLGSCHDTGGFCTSDFDGANMFGYVGGAAAAAVSGTFAVAAVLPRRRPALLGAAAGLIVAALWIARIEG